MDQAAQLDEIIGLFGRLGIEVREERLGGAGGGLCTLHGKQTVFVDLDADLASQVEHGVRALAAVPGLDTVFVTPALRERIERVRGMNRDP